MMAAVRSFIGPCYQTGRSDFAEAGLLVWLWTCSSAEASFATGKAAGGSGAGMVAIAMVAVGCRRVAPTLVEATDLE